MQGWGGVIRHRLHPAVNENGRFSLGQNHQQIWLSEAAHLLSGNYLGQRLNRIWWLTEPCVLGALILANSWDCGAISGHRGWWGQDERRMRLRVCGTSSGDIMHAFGSLSLEVGGRT